ncbi:glycosyltransferase [Alteromonas oceanisediminis]|uniref:glycosyltransferase n=1 Tax=Alteromonas oceanisediminis TaxID=2836180 RepID=UPI001BD9BFE7|nr:glycosyltransferase [Alteromonas oceanisediminis]MBT0587778.1 glycosyltransferase [Alteromonas oceanisediminis]
MKVLHIFGIMNRGGAELRTVSLIPKMQKHNIEFDFVALSAQRGVLDSDLEKQGCQIHYVRLGLGMFWPLYRLLASGQYSAVHSHVSLVSGLVLLIARVAGVKKRIAHFRNTTDVAHEGPLRRLRNTVFKKLIRQHATHVLGVCQGALDGYWSQQQQQDPRFSVIYNGFPLPTDSVQPAFWRAYPEIRENEPVFINVARMDYQKNHVRQVDIFAQYVAQFNSGSLVFIGKENEDVKQAMLAAAREHNIDDRLLFLGEQSNVMPFLANASAMLFPSMWEGLPGGVIEAASVGIPVLGSDIPGINEIAGQLPQVIPFQLSRSDAEWAGALHQAYLQAADQTTARAQFAHSIFQIDANVDQLRRIYSE